MASGNSLFAKNFRTIDIDQNWVSDFLENHGCESYEPLDNCQGYIPDSDNCPTLV
jgi:hypothetical protein